MSDKIIWSQKELEELIERKLSKQSHPQTSEERQNLSKRRYTVFFYTLFLLFNAGLACLLTYAFLETKELARVGIFLLAAGITSGYWALMDNDKITWKLP